MTQQNGHSDASGAIQSERWCQSWSLIHQIQSGGRLNGTARFSCGNRLAARSGRHHRGSTFRSVSGLQRFGTRFSRARSKIRRVIRALQQSVRHVGRRGGGGGRAARGRDSRRDPGALHRAARHVGRQVFSVHSPDGRLIFARSTRRGDGDEPGDCCVDSGLDWAFWVYEERAYVTLWVVTRLYNVRMVRTTVELANVRLEVE
ncbi:hypothetical protein GN958_ATG21656 [Phytophthora infestans]|uniref:Uncharacterized protein n=1 Tax=Phytophthora infestans TaxID=4787 RepID=A0A8S9TL07_PHYIN|nr:hypothetical protein GN958_ATG21656 [Phytophthora infestans]